MDTDLNALRKKRSTIFEMITVTCPHSCYTEVIMYRPRYCCECGQRIERERWRSWHSRGFCDRCAPKIRFDWFGRNLALVTLGVVIGFAFGSWDAARQVKPAPLLSIEPATVAQTDSGHTVTQPQDKESSPIPQNPTDHQAPSQDSISDQSSTETANRAKPESIPAHVCGAVTKSGKPCRRRVKGGGRCWQHRGK